MAPEEFATGDPLFTVDGGLTVLTWNAGAERLTGVPAAEAIGRPCWDLLGGLGEGGDVICHARCSNARLAREGFPLTSRPMLVRTSNGRTRVDVSTLTLADGRLLHVLQPPRPRGRPAVDLSRRQHEVLGLLANGYGAKSIARELGLAQTTVRTYIRVILRELGAHSQLEAVAKARHAGLV
jgi:DNA-binding CsgD family transcriptional regulator